MCPDICYATVQTASVWSPYLAEFTRPGPFVSQLAGPPDSQSKVQTVPILTPHVVGEWVHHSFFHLTNRSYSLLVTRAQTKTANEQFIKRSVHKTFVCVRLVVYVHPCVPVRACLSLGLPAG